MITRSVSPAFAPPLNPQPTPTDPVVPRVALISDSALQAFALDINAALIAALSARGEDMSSVARQRRLRAYAAPRPSAAVKLQRIA